MSMRTYITRKSLAGLFSLLVSGASASAMQYQAVDYSYVGNYGTVVTGMSGGHAGGYNRYDFYYIEHQKRYRLHAIYWPDANAAPVELNAFNSPYSQVSAVSGNRQVGTASVLIGGSYYARAILWHGTAKSARDITMAGYDNSFAFGFHDSQVVGQANGTATGGYVHAVVWDLKNSSIADLNGNDHQESGAVATSGSQQVGWATDPYGADIHAMLWSGTHDSQIDLNPSKFFVSYANAIDGQSQVGIGETLSSAHALLWHGSAASAVDLNPTGYVDSYATGVSGNKQVGYATKSDFKYHAMVWSGKPNKFVDLHASLPPTLTQSYATSIDAKGNIGGYATEADGTPHAIVWQPMK
jgi:hypothetical protein